MSRLPAFARHGQVGLERGRRAAAAGDVVVGERDLAICATVASLRFATTEQLHELFWPGRSERVARRRLLALFQAGYLERLRPYAYRGIGSFSWTYHLGARGHQLLVESGLREGRFQLARVHDYSRVLHDLQANSWLLAYRRVVGAALREWVGEVDGQLLPPRRPARTVDGWAVERVSAPRPVRPDATLVVGTRRLLIEFERRRRVDNSLDKFERYDSFLAAWWRDVLAPDADPYVVFVCADDEVRDVFVRAAHARLQGCLTHPAGAARGRVWPARRRVLFAVEEGVHSGGVDAVRLAAAPGDRLVLEKFSLPS